MPAVDGIASGFDTSGLIEAITDLALQPAVQMRQRKSGIEDKLEKLTEFSNLVKELGEAAEELSADGALGALTATSSNELATITADPDVATPGAYEVRKVRNARAETERSRGQASSGLGTLAHGTLTVNYAGESYDITIDGSNDGLDALAETLNAEVPGINAAVVDQGFGTNPFRLTVTGDTGAENRISFGYAGFSGATSRRLDFSETQTARDAEIRVNNVLVRSPTDVFDSVPGVSLDVSAIDNDTTFRVQVEPDPDTAVERVQAFVDKYNEVQEFYARNTVFNAEIDLAGPFSGESSVRRVADGLGSIISGSYSVPDSVSGLSEIGIATERGGTLELDADALRTQLVENFDAVQGFLASDDGPLKALQSRIEDVYIAPETGTLESREDSLESTIADLEESISKQEAYVDDYSARLRERFTAMEGAIAASQATGAYLASLFGGPSPSDS
jgi:flagellar hook-associated protein 2